MFTVVIAQRLGVQSDLVTGLSLLEGICLTIVLMLLAERYLFSAKSRMGRRSAGRLADAVVPATDGASSGTA
jgi:hypothetical protein